MQVTGKYLATVCKLIFKISRQDKNDNLFLDINVLTLFVDILGLATPHEDAESLIYGYGALKFLTMNPDLMERAMKNGCLSLMLLHLKMINLERTERHILPETINHVLYQLTGTLRNVVNDRRFYAELLSSGGLTIMYRTLELFSRDIDIVTNISRIFRYRYVVYVCKLQGRVQGKDMMSRSLPPCGKSTKILLPPKVYNILNNIFQVNTFMIFYFLIKMFV